MLLIVFFLFFALYIMLMRAKAYSNKTYVLRYCRIISHNSAPN